MLLYLRQHFWIIDCFFFPDHRKIVDFLHKCVLLHTELSDYSLMIVISYSWLLHFFYEVRTDRLLFYILNSKFPVPWNTAYSLLFSAEGHLCLFKCFSNFKEKWLCKMMLNHKTYAWDYFKILWVTAQTATDTFYCYMTSNSIVLQYIEK